jgi:hypothetical protein
MKKTLVALIAAGALLAGCADTVAVTKTAASSTTTTTEPAVTPSGALGGYQPVSDVGEHAKISADLCDIEARLTAAPVDFTAARAVYRDGKHSAEGDGRRTLGKFALESRSSEDTLGHYERYLGRAWLDVFVDGALTGAGPFAGEAPAVRRVAAEVGMRDQIVVAWALHELDAAVEKAKNSSYVKKTGAPHNWDEVWAYYHGEKPLCGPYATADARGKDFGKGTAVNEAILAAMQKGLEAMKAKNASDVAKARDEVFRQITITYVRAAIKAVNELDAALARGKPDEARLRQVEGWASFRVIEPLVAAANTTAARAVTGLFDPAARPAPGSAAKVTAALGSAYTPLRLAPSDIGDYHPD